MIKNNKIAVALTIAGGAALAFASLAGAQTSSTTPNPAPPAPADVSNQVVQIGPAGRATLRGTLVSVGQGSLTVKSWGGNWIINVAADAEIIPRVSGNAADIASFKAGDVIGVQGTVATDAAWTINAKVVRDRTLRQTVNENAKDVRQIEKQGRAEGVGRVFQGTASNVTQGSFTLTTDGGQSQTVNVSANTKLVNRIWLALPSLSSTQNGDKVRVFGTADASGTITAQTVRDVSLPASSH